MGCRQFLHVVFLPGATGKVNNTYETFKFKSYFLEFFFPDHSETSAHSLVLRLLLANVPTQEKGNGQNGTHAGKTTPPQHLWSSCCTRRADRVQSQQSAGPVQVDCRFEERWCDTLEFAFIAHFKMLSSDRIQPLAESRDESRWIFADSQYFSTHLTGWQPIYAPFFST